MGRLNLQQTGEPRRRFTPKDWIVILSRLIVASASESEQQCQYQERDNFMPTLIETNVASGRWLRFEFDGPMHRTVTTCQLVADDAS